MREVNFDKNKVFFDHKIVEFQYDIMQLITENENVFTLLKIPFNQELGYNEFHNVYCYNQEGEKVWQIGERNKEIDDNIVFVMINIIDEQLFVNDFLGRKFIVNKHSGTIDSDNIEITK